MNGPQVGDILERHRFALESERAQPRCQQVLAAAVDGRDGLHTDQLLGQFDQRLVGFIRVSCGHAMLR
ncbi:MAG: hypothetical protein U5O39_00905 [Gammaproteobacteria bacterium]|nr:hypothetical protein [Gammaproteobacteria bacterium]